MLEVAYQLKDCAEYFVASKMWVSFLNDWAAFLYRNGW